MSLSPEQPLARSLEKIAQETIDTYQSLFISSVLPGVVKGWSNIKNTEGLAKIFTDALPKNPAERQTILDACERNDPLVQLLEGAYTAYQTLEK